MRPNDPPKQAFRTTWNRGRTALLGALALNLGCAWRGPVSGVVQEAEVGMVLRGFDGESYPLILDHNAAPLAYLEGCTVRLEGSRMWGTLRVRDWQVTAAADGSAPFVGVLRNHGSNLVMDDRNTGSVLVMDGEDLESLRTHEGKLALVVGYVVGPHVVRVVDYRVLGPEEAP